MTAVALDPVPCLRGLDPATVDQSDPRGTVYLQHLDLPLVFDTGTRVRLARPGEDLSGHLAMRHYYGWCARGNLEKRMVAHRTGSGSRFLRIARRHGATWHLARTWPGDRAEERRHKNMGGARRACPSCGVDPLGAPRRESNGRFTGRETPVITIHRDRVLRGSTVVARLSWGGDGLSVVTVRSEPGGEPVGRLIRRDDSFYDAWTALHPAAMTPSDRQLATRVSAEEAIEAVLDEAAAVRALDEEIVRQGLAPGRIMPACGDPDCYRADHQVTA